MFNWMVKVVPQPPDAAETEETVKTPDAPPKITEAAVKPPPPKNTEEVSEDGHAQTGVLGWLSNGFVSALPQPSGSPRLSRANSEAKSGEDGDRSGVINWVSQGLTKVLPQPDEKYRETQMDTKDEEHTEVYDVATMPDFDPLPHIPVVEMVSDEETSEIESTTSHFPPNVVTWIKQIVPQPVPPGAVPVEPSTKSSRSSLDKILSPPPESLSGISLDTDSKASGVVNWFVSGLGLKMPQPATPAKDEVNSASEVIQKASAKLKPDMVLEDVESDNEGQQKCEDPPKADAPSASLVPPSPAAQQQQEAKEVAPSVSVASQKCSDAEPEPQPLESAAKISLEDAETQTGRWTPFIENIKKEAEGVALATMEERLLQERMEMARMAEEVARQTAEMAVRQMASEGQSIKFSLGSQELLEEPEIELPVPLEEESEVELSKVTEMKESLAQEEQNVETEEPAIKPEPKEEASISPPPSSEPVINSEPEPEQAPQPEPAPEPQPQPEPAPESAPEPETKTQEATPEAEPVTEQPQKKEENGQAANADKAPEKEEEATDCGENSNISLRPAVNVEDVDSDHEKAGGATGGGEGEGGEGGGGGGGGGEEQIPQILTPQDPKLTTLTVPVTPSGGRQSKGDKDSGRNRRTVWTKIRRLHSESEDDDEEGSIPVRAWPSQSSLHSTDDVLKERPASSASQTSTVVNERLQELVRMFKERTEKAKEKLIDPDSSDEDSIITC